MTWNDGRDDRWRDSYDEWKTRSPDDDYYHDGGPDYDDDDPRYGDDDVCDDCGGHDGEHAIWCQFYELPPLPAKRPLLVRLKAWWRGLRYPPIDDDIPF